MTSGHQAVEWVIQTATSLVAKRLAPREAVTILASQVPHARAAATALVRSDSERAETYAELLASLTADLRAQLDDTDDPRDLRAVVKDLDGLVRALSSA